jgi:RNA polymerase sigma-70 factor (ECF subfamily)
MQPLPQHNTDPHLSTVSDQDARDVLRAQGGDQMAYKAIYDRNMAELFRFLTQFSDDRTLISDWVQMAFIKAFQNMDKFQGKSAFKSWLFRIAINEMKQSFRSAHREPDYMDEEQLYSYPDQRSSPADWITIKDKIRRLPDRQRLVFLMFEIEGFSHAEIAQVLNITESSSRSILTRVKIQLRQSLIDL